MIDPLVHLYDLLAKVRIHGVLLLYALALGPTTPSTPVPWLPGAGLRPRSSTILRATGNGKQGIRADSDVNRPVPNRTVIPIMRIFSIA
jgi:hypothetical protein